MQRRILIFCSFAAFFLIHSLSLAQTISIKGEDVNIRSGPSFQNNTLFKVGNGFPLKVLKRSGEWIQVEDFEGSKGWVNAKVTNKDQHVVVKANKGTNKHINIRSAPSIKTGKVVATATYGVVFKVLERKQGWVRVEHGNGVKGWVQGSLLWEG